MYQPHRPRRLGSYLRKDQESTYVGDILRYEMDISAALIRRVKWRDDGILLDSVKVHTRFLGKEGQYLSILLSEDSRSGNILSVPGPLTIVHQDEDFLILNKDAGVVVHPTHAHKDDTLGNFLLHYYEEIGFPGDFHPVHRLDRGTSGLLVVAKHPYAQEQFKKQLHSPFFQREYLALAWGELPQAQGTIQAPILSQEKMKRTVHPEGLHAVTHYQLLSQGSYQGKPLSLVALKLETGRTHQIRVHLSHLGHPLLGDELYGAGDILSHTALHAFRLSLQQPVTKEALVFTAAPPPDFCQLLEKSQISLPSF